MNTVSAEKLLQILRQEGPQDPGSLMKLLKVSQPTLFRLEKSQSQQIIAVGAKRNRKLAALRNIRNLGFEFPVFIVSASGEITSLGRLISIYPTGTIFLRNAKPGQPEIFSGLPFFVDELRPQGFLGRTFSQTHSDLKLPPRVTDWTNNDILEGIVQRGEDLSGNILIGAESFERYLALTQNNQMHGSEIKKESYHSSADYLILAQNAVDGELIGSSVAGEQPKFVVTLKPTDESIPYKVIVKFSPAGSSFTAQRWRDLLICEALALKLLSEFGFAAAQCKFIELQDRAYLEVIRFDRIGLTGRRGIISLSALENEWSGRGENWAVSAQLLKREKKISEETLVTIQKLECFGRMIANTDRHSGNLSFFWEPGQPQAVLAPVYDMLPMLYAPSTGGENTNRKFELPIYDYTLLQTWKEMIPIAIEYWNRIQQDSRISESFRKLTQDNAKILHRS